MLPTDFDIEKISKIFSLQIRNLPLEGLDQKRGGIKNEYHKKDKRRGA